MGPSERQWPKDKGRRCAPCAAAGGILTLLNGIYDVAEGFGLGLWPAFASFVLADPQNHSPGNELMEKPHYTFFPHFKCCCTVRSTLGQLKCSGK